MNQAYDEQLIGEYLEGTATAEQIRQVRQWLAEDPALAQLIDALQQDRQLLQSADPQTLDETTCCQLDVMVDELIDRHPLQKPDDPHSVLARIGVSCAAAAAAVVIGLGVWYLPKTAGPGDMLAGRQKTLVESEDTVAMENREQKQSAEPRVGADKSAGAKQEAVLPDAMALADQAPSQSPASPPMAAQPQVVAECDELELKRHADAAAGQAVEPPAVGRTSTALSARKSRLEKHKADARTSVRGISTMSNMTMDATASSAADQPMVESAGAGRGAVTAGDDDAKADDMPADLALGRAKDDSDVQSPKPSVSMATRYAQPRRDRSPVAPGGDAGQATTHRQVICLVSGDIAITRQQVSRIAAQHGGEVRTMSRPLEKLKNESRDDSVNEKSMRAEQLLLSVPASQVSQVSRRIMQVSALCFADNTNRRADRQLASGRAGVSTRPAAEASTDAPAKYRFSRRSAKVGTEESMVQLQVVIMPVQRPAACLPADVAEEAATQPASRQAEELDAATSSPSDAPAK